MPVSQDTEDQPQANPPHEGMTDDTTPVAVTVVRPSDEWGGQTDWEALARRCAVMTLSQECPASSLAGEAPWEVTIVLGDDQILRDLNRRFRGQDRPTNVLAFPAGGYETSAQADAAHPEMGGYLGDVILARETLFREAETAGKSVAAHFAHLVVHGILHLLGHDHHTDREAEIMETAERRILKAMGFPDPYEEGP